MPVVWTTQNNRCLVTLYGATVRAAWDPEGSVWVAESDDVPGLATEAVSIEALFGQLGTLIPELLEANGVQLPHGELTQ